MPTSLVQLNHVKVLLSFLNEAPLPRSSGALALFLAGALKLCQPWSPHQASRGPESQPSGPVPEWMALDLRPASPHPKSQSSGPVPDPTAVDF